MGTPASMPKTRFCRGISASLMDGLKNLSDRLKVLDVSLFGLAGYLIQPADRGWFQARLGGVVFRVHDLDLHFHRILATSYPTFSLLASFRHCQFTD